MTTVLVIAAVIVAASFCPAMMWWNARRDRRGCLPARGAADDETGDLDALRRENDALTAQIAELQR